MKNLLRLLLLILLPAAAPAQDAPPDPDDGRRYRVDVIIFAYRQADSVGTEIFVPERLDEDSNPELSFGDAEPPAAPEPLDELRYRILDTDDVGLEEAWGFLSRLQAYEPLMRFGWVQEVVPDADTPPLALDRFGTPPPGLEGTLSLSLSRYLHLGVDLTLAAEAAPLAPVAAPLPERTLETGDARPDSVPAYAPLTYEIKETRIVKSGDVRYYDHPYFGVIARVTRADDPDASSGGN